MLFYLGVPDNRGKPSNPASNLELGTKESDNLISDQQPRAQIRVGVKNLVAENIFLRLGSPTSKTLISVSNRLPVTVEEDRVTKSSGGLVGALEGLPEGGGRARERPDKRAGSSLVATSAGCVHAQRGAGRMLTLPLSPIRTERLRPDRATTKSEKPREIAGSSTSVIQRT